jgi:hypothetical protein
VDQRKLSEALTLAVSGSGPESALAVCRACVAWLPMDGASITIMAGPDRQEPVCATGPTAARIDELQFSLADGPCVEAFTTGRAVLVSDITDPADGRWPVFASSAAETGARGMYVFPLRVGAARIGVLDCYRTRPGMLNDTELAGALRAADAAAWTLLDHAERSIIVAEPVTDGSMAATQPGWDWFDGAALARAEIHQATGMLMAQARIGAREALAQLRAAAFSAGRSLAEVAIEVLDRRLRLDPDGSWHSTGPPPGVDPFITNDPGAQEEPS